MKTPRHKRYARGTIPYYVASCPYTKLSAYKYIDQELGTAFIKLLESYGFELASGLPMQRSRGGDIKMINYEIGEALIIPVYEINQNFMLGSKGLKKYRQFIVKYFGLNIPLTTTSHDDPPECKFKRFTKLRTLENHLKKTINNIKEKEGLCLDYPKT